MDKCSADRGYINNQGDLSFKVVADGFYQRRVRVVKGQECAYQNIISHAAHQQYECVNDHGPLRKMVFAHPAGGKGHQREPEQQMDIGPKHFPVDMLHYAEQVVMVVPIKSDVHKAEEVAEKYGRQRTEII